MVANALRRWNRSLKSPLSFLRGERGTLFIFRLWEEGINVNVGQSSSQFSSPFKYYHFQGQIWWWIFFYVRKQTERPTFKQKVKLVFTMRYQLHYSLLSTADVNDLGLKSDRPTKSFNAKHSPSHPLLIAPILGKMTNARYDHPILVFKLLKEILGQTLLHFSITDWS